MKIRIELREVELDVLSALHAHRIGSMDELVSALSLIRQTERNFGRLLEQVLAAGRLPVTHRFRDGDVYRALMPEVTRSIDALAVYGYVERTPVFRDVSVAGKKPAKVLVTHALALTADGTRVAEAHLRRRTLMLRAAPADRMSVFVACAFRRAELDQLYARELVPACNALDLVPYRVDTVEPAATITDELLQGIRDARIMIADLTHARPSVYFEVGVALGLGVPIVLTCRSDHNPGLGDPQRVHFDLQQFRISYWTLVDDTFVWEGGPPLERMSWLLSRKS